MHKNSLSIEFWYWEQMLKHRFVKKFQLTAIKEVEKFAQRKIYESIEKKNQNQIKKFFIWIFKYKFNIDGYFIKFKTQLCVKENLQTIYENTYAAILTAKIFKTVMIIAIAFDMKIHQFDAINVFINSKLDEEILCKCFEKFRQSNKCWKLFRILYDLKQTSMLWYKKFISILKNLSLMSVFKINCLYVLRLRSSNQLHCLIRWISKCGWMNFVNLNLVKCLKTFETVLRK